MSDPAPGPRGFDDLVGDLESVLAEAGGSPPYVLVGTSGGGLITAGYAYRHPDDVAGELLQQMVHVDRSRERLEPVVGDEQDQVVGARAREELLVRGS